MSSPQDSGSLQEKLDALNGAIAEAQAGLAGLSLSEEGNALCGMAADVLKKLQRVNEMINAPAQGAEDAHTEEGPES